MEVGMCVITMGLAGTGEMHASYPQKCTVRGLGSLPVLHTCPSSAWNPEALDPTLTRVMNHTLAAGSATDGWVWPVSLSSGGEGGKQPSAPSPTSVVLGHDEHGLSSQPGLREVLASYLLAL